MMDNNKFFPPKDPDNSTPAPVDKAPENESINENAAIEKQAKAPELDPDRTLRPDEASPFKKSPFDPDIFKNSPFENAPTYQSGTPRKENVVIPPRTGPVNAYSQTTSESVPPVTGQTTAVPPVTGQTPTVSPVTPQSAAVPPQAGSTGEIPAQNTQRPAYTQGGYAYTQTNNPNINRDIPKGGIRTTYVNSNTGVYNTPPYTGTTAETNTVPQKAEKKKKKKEKNKIPGSLIAVTLVFCILFSSLFGIGGMYVGYKMFSGENTSSTKITGDGKIDTKAPTTTVVDNTDGSVTNAANIAGNAVVEITTETVTTSFFYGNYVQSGAGSGVIIDATDGYIITCAHVIEGASAVTVTLKDGTEYDAEIIGSDARTDIAVIKVTPEAELTAATIADSDTLVVGQTAIAIGNPLGTLGGTVSSGIISALNREITIDGQAYSLLQIDTSINPGNSGGGLFDIAGNLIGVVNAKSSGDGSTTIEGLGFAIPINQAMEVANQLVSNGYVGGRVGLGIMVYEINESTQTGSLYQSEYRELLDYVTDYGIYFLEYQSGQNGDFQFGDRIIAIDDTPVSALSDVTALLEEYSVGDEVTVIVSRLNSDKKRSKMVRVKVALIEQVPTTEQKAEEEE